MEVAGRKGSPGFLRRCCRGWDFGRWAWGGGCHGSRCAAHRPRGPRARGLVPNGSVLHRASPPTSGGSFLPPPSAETCRRRRSPRPEEGRRRFPEHGTLKPRPPQLRVGFHLFFPIYSSKAQTRPQSLPQLAFHDASTRFGGLRVSEMTETWLRRPALGLQRQPGSFTTATEFPGWVMGSVGIFPGLCFRGFAPCKAQGSSKTKK